jgi:hypothetical protein
MCEEREPGWLETSTTTDDLGKGVHYRKTGKENSLETSVDGIDLENGLCSHTSKGAACFCFRDILRRFVVYFVTYIYC